MKRLLVTAVTASALLAACAGGTAAPVSGAIPITAQDYRFSGVPDVVASGAQLTLTNASEAEFHEMVVMRIVDGETRTLDELLALPEAESESLAEFQGVLVAFPGEDAINPEGGDASVTVTEPGRYAIFCFIPQGADPEAVRTAMTAPEGEGPELEGGPPHFTLGMATEFQVEAP
jgi:hypothetical protein